MATIQHTISVNAPVQTVYKHLTQFEEYPRFMEDVESVQQTDDFHLHWTARMENRPIEWDAKITNQEPDHCIAWQNISGPAQNGKVEMQPLGPDASQVTFTLQTESQQVPGSMEGYTEDGMAMRLQQDLARLKGIIESGGQPHENDIGLSDTALQARSAAGHQPTRTVQAKAQTASPIPMRHLGQLPQDTTDEEHASAPASDSIGKTSYTLLHDPADMEQTQNSGETAMRAQSESISHQDNKTVTGQPAAMPDNAGAAVVGAHGGTDASAGAQLSGSKGGPGGTSLRQETDAASAPGSPGGMVEGDNITPGAGANAAGGSGLGASATADDTRTGTGTTSGSGTSLTGGGMSGARDASKSQK